MCGKFAVIGSIAELQERYGEYTIKVRLSDDELIKQEIEARLKRVVQCSAIRTSADAGSATITFQV